MTPGTWNDHADYFIIISWIAGCLSILGIHMNCFVYVVWDLSIKTYTSPVSLKRLREFTIIFAVIHLGHKKCSSAFVILPPYEINAVQ